MRHHHTDSPLRLAIVALQDSDGYVDALLGLARDQIVARRPAISYRLSHAPFHPDPRNAAPRSRADLHWAVSTQAGGRRQLGMTVVDDHGPEA
jgi:hypothetical protein